MASENVIIRFEKVSFTYGDKKVILDEANFNVRKNSIVTIIGQNGAGKSTIFKMLEGKLKPQGGRINIETGATIGIAEQMVPAAKIDLSLREYFKTAVPHLEYGLEGDIHKILNVVNLDLPLDKKVRDLSGGQKARLLLAYALISNPDILLLDEPTNNLDKTGIDHLMSFLINYKKTCIVISHDSDFLNAFTDGVLNLDVHTHKVEQFVGNYYDVLDEMAAKLERDRMANARLEKSIKDRFEKVNKLGGKSVAMNRLARKIREDIEEDKEDTIELRKEDKTIPEFIIPNQEFVGYVIRLNKVSSLKGNHEVFKDVNIQMAKGDRLQIKGPNGIGKSTLLKAILTGKGSDINPQIRIGYYSQDFSELNYSQTAFESLMDISITKKAQDIYTAAGRFLLNGELLQNKIESLSEGQKGLLCYARFTLQQPGLLILDEPTNHINFRHIPIIAKAIDNYEGPVIIVSHLPEFVEKIKNLQELSLE